MTDQDLACEAEWTWEVRTRLGQLVARPANTGWRMDGQRRLNTRGQINLIVSVECCSTIDNIETGDELWLYRNNRVVFFGPVQKETDQQPNGIAEILAFDRSWWWEGRFFGTDLDWTGRDAGHSLQDVLAASATIDPAVALTWADPPPGYNVGIVVSLRPTFNTSMREIVETLADTAIDYTVIGDRILVGTDGTGADPLPTLTAASWDEGRFTGIQDHDDYASTVIVNGFGRIQAQWPPAPIGSPFPEQPPNVRWGARTIQIGDFQLADQASCLLRARAEYSRRNPPPRRVSVPDGALVDRRVRFAQLVPGAPAVVQVPTTCGDTRMVEMLLATVKWHVTQGKEDRVTAAFVEQGAPFAET